MENEPNIIGNEETEIRKTIKNHTKSGLMVKKQICRKPLLHALPVWQLFDWNLEGKEIAKTPKFELNLLRIGEHPIRIFGVVFFPTQVHWSELL